MPTEKIFKNPPLESGEKQIAVADFQRRAFSDSDPERMAVPPFLKISASKFSVPPFERSPPSKNPHL